MKRASLILALSFGLLASCNRTSNTAHVSNGVNTITFYGLLKKQGVTAYQYGTHVISNGNQTYALQSSTIRLNAYADKNVTVTGTKVEGYPLEGGPELIEVTKVE